MTTIAMILLLFCLFIAAALVTGCTLFVFAAWGHNSPGDREESPPAFFCTVCGGDTAHTDSCPFRDLGKGPAWLIAQQAEVEAAEAASRERLSE